MIDILEFLMKQREEVESMLAKHNIYDEWHYMKEEARLTEKIDNYIATQ